MCTPSAEITRLFFAEVPFLVELQNSPEIADALEVVLPDWGFIEVTDTPDDETPRATISKTDERTYQFLSWWGRRPLTKLGTAGAACGAVADMLQAFLDARPGVFGLHCGAVRIGEHLVAFTGRYRSGKTTLVTRLSAEPDFEIFCDDVLPIEPDGNAMALGVQPRLRLPLPPKLPSDFYQFAEEKMTVRDKRYGFVLTPNQAPKGRQAPLAALIVLSRTEEGPAQFHEIPTSEAAAYLIRQNIADPGEIEAHYDKIAAMAQGVSCLLLTYSDLEEAVALIRKAFCSENIPANDASIGPPRAREIDTPNAPPANLEDRFRRGADIIERVIGANTFLWQMESRQFFNLNPVGGAVWALLEKPCTGSEIRNALAAVFTDVCSHTIETDLALLLGQMQQRGVVEATNNE